ncbi:hypothetical protein [Pseudomonas sp. KT_2_4]|uniref:hypothetical protein n=1 Tax=Pseudomonas sp. KT_2_4 TaxID=3241600 RepID=UPI00352B0D08
MSDNTELKRLAEAHVQKDIVDPIESTRVMLVEPKTVLALIAESEQLREAHEQICTSYNKVSYASEERGKQIDQLKAELEHTGYDHDLLRNERDQLKAAISTPELVFINMKSGRIAKISLRSAIDLHGEVINGDDAQQIEIAKLRAEVAGLRTGYESYERVNAELKAEVEELRKERDARHPFKPFHEPSIGYTGCVICGVYTDHGGLPCPKTRATAYAALGQGEQS